MKCIRRLAMDQTGSWMLVMTVGLLPVLLLFNSFGLDFSRVFLLKHQLQGALDAAALAGAASAEIHFVYSGGAVSGVTPVINRPLAEAEAAAVLQANIALTHLTDQDVRIVSQTLSALDDTHFRVDVTADIKSCVAGPVIHMLLGDSSFLFSRVRRTAVAEVRI